MHPRRLTIERGSCYCCMGRGKKSGNWAPALQEILLNADLGDQAEDIIVGCIVERAHVFFFEAFA
jgi:hypothetical protein